MRESLDNPRIRIAPRSCQLLQGYQPMRTSTQQAKRGYIALSREALNDRNFRTEIDEYVMNQIAPYMEKESVSC